MLAIAIMHHRIKLMPQPDIVSKFSVYKCNGTYHLYLVTANPLIYIAPVLPIKHKGGKNLGQKKCNFKRQAKVTCPF